ncbi:hypothetical protein [Pectobacterium parmentieri]|uniref:Holin n=1 Tax=Pectobacterium parmentieri TaxID=1905730 RepID=A0A8B3F4I6_PECPM|nr:hypothetical protein [Pectobacterium parmentieri]AOR59256.1 hypothetical protein A8F97_10065 [Pectobacterium parmentieri]AYH09729.1 hypothetical protein C5E24_08570 [Pectobacterium parmentieri]AYH19562.1 hypothetical protein C5E22_14230 [Pectobacterium parmentieri]AYH36049.1 hypothetical protein C5E17_08520 [Pectobacterium parmentieri]AZS56153.1 hypothetical protein C5E18_08515 [Pectobacterium parmentieri]
MKKIFSPLIKAVFVGGTILAPMGHVLNQLNVNQGVSFLIVGTAGIILGYTKWSNVDFNKCNTKT